jgi:hypothetical protein
MRLNKIVRIASLFLHGGLIREWRNKRRINSGISRILLKRPSPKYSLSWSVRRINTLLKIVGPGSRYLEIGVLYGHTLENIACKDKTAVDPSPLFNLEKLPSGLVVHKTTSDSFFPSSKQYDVIFVDGLHKFHTAYGDTISSLRSLNRGGVVLLDDSIPQDEASALPDPIESAKLRKQLNLYSHGSPWLGDVYKVVLVLNEFHRDHIEFMTVENSGNAQTLVWFRPGFGPMNLSNVDEAELDPILKLTYSEVFSKGIPDCFNVCSEQQAISSYENTRRSSLLDSPLDVET